MKNLLTATVLLAAVIGLGLTAAMGNSAMSCDDPAIMASPQTIVLAKVDSVTIHSNIPASDVDAASVTLNGVAASGVWADNLGHLAARFALADLALEPGSATLTLCGDYDDPADGSFSASDDVTVK